MVRHPVQAIRVRDGCVWVGADGQHTVVDFVQPNCGEDQVSWSQDEGLGSYHAAFARTRVFGGVLRVRCAPFIALIVALMLCLLLVLLNRWCFVMYW